MTTDVLIYSQTKIHDNVLSLHMYSWIVQAELHDVRASLARFHVIARQAAGALRESILHAYDATICSPL